MLNILGMSSSLRRVIPEIIRTKGLVAEKRDCFESNAYTCVCVRVDIENVSFQTRKLFSEYSNKSILEISIACIEGL